MKSARWHDHQLGRNDLYTAEAEILSPRAFGLEVVDQGLQAFSQWRDLMGRDLPFKGSGSGRAAADLSKGGQRAASRLACPGLKEGSFRRMGAATFSARLKTVTGGVAS